MTTLPGGMKEGGVNNYSPTTMSSTHPLLIRWLSISAWIGLMINNLISLDYYLKKLVDLPATCPGRNAIRSALYTEILDLTEKAALALA